MKTLSLAVIRSGASPLTAFRAVFLSLTGALLVAACGGGGSGGSPADTGPAGPLVGIVAADGAAMAFGIVSVNSLVDSTSYLGTADRYGNLSALPSGITYPAIVKVQSLSGGKVNYGYMASASQTDVPVNPLTTLVLAIAANANPASITQSAQLTLASLAAAKSAVNSIFSQIFQAFSVSAASDLLTTNFATDHTGLDFVIDALNVKFDALGNPTLCTKLFNSCKTLTLASLDTTALPITQAEAQSLGAAPIAACSNAIRSFTSASLTSDASLYASDFLNSGLNAAAYRQAMASRFAGLSAHFTNPAFIGKDASDNFVFSFDYFNQSGNQYVGSFLMPFKLSAGQCVMAGDQLPFSVQVTSQITLQTRVDGTNDPAVTTATPVRGLVFRAGGDGFGGTGVQNTVLVGGSPVTIETLKFFLCDANNNCSRPLIDMVKGYNNNGYYYTPNGVNTIPTISYALAGLATPAEFYNGNPRPILVQMLDGGGTVQKAVRLRVRGGYISQAEMAAISLPAVTNAQALLAGSGSVTNPVLNLNIPNGIIVQGVSVASGDVSAQVTSTPRFVLSGTSTTAAVQRVIDAASTYRSIQMNANTVGGTPIWIKYVWSPSCSGCS